MEKHYFVSMEMVGMEAKLIKLDFVDEQKAILEFSNKSKEAVLEFSKKVKNEVKEFIDDPKGYPGKKKKELIIDEDEFLEILNKAVELGQIDINTLWNY